MYQPRVYLETSFVSYLAAGLQGRFSADVDIAARQISSRTWWEQHRNRFALFISGVVYEECCSGHEEAAQSRLAVLAQAAILPSETEIMKLAALLVEPSGPLPKRAEADAAHIAFATVYGCEYLLTWKNK